MRRLMISCFLMSILELVSAGRVAGDTFTWELPASPTIMSGDYTGGLPFFEDGSYSLISGAPFSENGIPQAPGVFQFSTPAGGGGVALADSGLDTLFIDAFGPQVYSGMESAPTFVPGTYMLNNDLPDGPLGTLVIAQADGIDSFTYQFPAPTPTPEPSSLLLLLIGTGTLASVCFARRKKIVAHDHGSNSRPA